MNMNKISLIAIGVFIIIGAIVYIKESGSSGQVSASLPEKAVKVAAISQPDPVIKELKEMKESVKNLSKEISNLKKPQPAKKTPKVSKAPKASKASRVNGNDRFTPIVDELVLTKIEEWEQLPATNKLQIKKEDFKLLTSGSERREVSYPDFKVEIFGDNIGPEYVKVELLGTSMQGTDIVIAIKRDDFSINQETIPLIFNKKIEHFAIEGAFSNYRFQPVISGEFRDDRQHNQLLVHLKFNEVYKYLNVKNTPKPGRNWGMTVVPWHKPVLSYDNSEGVERLVLYFRHRRDPDILGKLVTRYADAANNRYIGYNVSESRKALGIVDTNANVNTSVNTNTNVRIRTRPNIITSYVAKVLDRVLYITNRGKDYGVTIECNGYTSYGSKGDIVYANNLRFIEYRGADGKFNIMHLPADIREKIRSLSVGEFTEFEI